MKRLFVVLNLCLICLAAPDFDVDLRHPRSRIRRATNSWGDLVKPVVQIMLPPRGLSGSSTHSLDAASIIGKVTRAASGHVLPQHIVQPVQLEIQHCHANMADQIRREQRMLKTEADWSRNQVSSHRGSLEERLDFIRRQGQYISSRVTDLHNGVEQGFADTQRELRKTALKMSIQVQKLREDSETAFTEVKGSLSGLHSRVARVDDNVDALRKETKESLEQLKKEMNQNTEKVLNSIGKLSTDMELNFAENAQLIIESTASVVDQVSALHSQMNGQFVVIDQSIARSEETVVNRLEEMHTEISTQLQGIDSTLEEIKDDLSFLQETFETKMNELQAAVLQIQTTLHQNKLMGLIDDMKSVVGAWTIMMQYAADNVPQNMKKLKIDRFNQLCQRHDPLSVLTWMQRNIYDRIKSPATTVPEDAFEAWQKGVLALRNDAYVMYAACLSAQNLDQATFDAEMKLRYGQMFSDNFLQQAASLDQLNYAQWWRQNIKETALVSDFDSDDQLALETKLSGLGSWIQSHVEKAEKVDIFTMETQANDTISVEELIEQIHSGATERNFTDRIFLCCDSHVDLCELRTEENLLHVCMGRSLWFRSNPDQSVTVISWWPSLIGLNYTRIPDNFFIQESNIGFAVPDMSLYSKTWNDTKNAIQVLSDEDSQRAKRSVGTWKWNVLLTDNICWWKQGSSEDCTNNQCQWKTDTGLSGPVMKIINDADRDKCCALCAGTKDCLAVAWSEQKICILYARFNRVVKQNGWMTASKLKDCTQCTNTAIDGCSQDFSLSDVTVNYSNYSSLQDISPSQCEQHCFKSSPLCVSYSWSLTDQGAVCQVNDQHGPIEPRIGSSLTLDLVTQQKCGKVIVPQPLATASPAVVTESKCQNGGTPRVDGDGCTCAPGFEGFDCSTANSCPRFTVANGQVEFNGMQVNSMFAINTKARVKCKPEYSLNGQEDVYCHMVGGWSQIPNCVLNVL